MNMYDARKFCSSGILLDLILSVSNFENGCKM